MKHLRESTLISIFHSFFMFNRLQSLNPWSCKSLQSACVGPATTAGALFGAGIMICWLLQSSRSRNSKALDSKRRDTYLRMYAGIDIWEYFEIWYDMIWYDMIWYDMIWYDRYIKLINQLYRHMRLGPDIGTIVYLMNIALFCWFHLWLAFHLLPRYQTLDKSICFHLRLVRSDFVGKLLPDLQQHDAPPKRMQQVTSGFITHDLEDHENTRPIILSLTRHNTHDNQSTWAGPWSQKDPPFPPIKSNFLLSSRHIGNRHTSTTLPHEFLRSYNRFRDSIRTRPSLRDSTSQCRKKNIRTIKNTYQMGSTMINSPRSWKSRVHALLFQPCIVDLLGQNSAIQRSRPCLGEILWCPVKPWKCTIIINNILITFDHSW